MKKYYLTLIIILLFTGFTSCSYVNPPKDPNTMYVHLPSEPGTLNPITSTDAYSSAVLKYLSETLLELHYDTLEYIPQLAQRWVVSPNRLKIRFYLKKGVLWSDGKEFTADDVVYSYKRIMDPKVASAQLRVYYINITNAVKLNKYMVEFHCKEPNYMSLSSCGDMPIVPKHIYDDGTDFNNHKNSRHPIGTGPYKFEKWDTGKQIVLRVNENYREKKPEIKRIVYKLIPEISVALQMLKKGDIDMMKLRNIQWIRQTKSERFKSRYHKLNFYISSYSYIGWNARKDVFKDRRVRVAMTHLVNRKDLLEKMNFGLGMVVTGPFFFKSKSNDTKIIPYPYNIDKAKELLKQAGWEDRDNDGYLDKDGKKFSFTFTITSASKSSQRLVTILKEDLEKVGIEMNINKFEWAVFLNKIQNHDFDATTLAWSNPAFTDDPYQLWHSSMAPKGSNYVYFINNEADRIIENGRREFNKEKREAMYRRLHHILHEEQPYTFMFSYPEKVVVSKRFTNIKIHTRGLNLLEWRVAKQ